MMKLFAWINHGNISSIKFYFIKHTIYKPVSLWVSLWVCQLFFLPESEKSFNYYLKLSNFVTYPTVIQYVIRQFCHHVCLSSYISPMCTDSFHSSQAAWRTSGGVQDEVRPSLTPRVSGAWGTGKTRGAGGLVTSQAGTWPSVPHNTGRVGPCKKKKSDFACTIVWYLFSPLAQIMYQGHLWAPDQIFAQRHTRCLSAVNPFTRHSFWSRNRFGQIFLIQMQIIVFLLLNNEASCPWVLVSLTRACISLTPSSSPPFMRQSNHRPMRTGGGALHWNRVWSWN